MDRIWQWAWDRYGTRYSWVICVISLPWVLMSYLAWAFLIVTVEGSDRYVEAGVVTAIVAPVLPYLVVLPGMRPVRFLEQWAAGRGSEVSRTTALESTYATARGAVVRGVVVGAIYGALVSVVVGAIAGATVSRLLQYGILGAAVGLAFQLTGAHAVAEATMRPARAAVAGDTGIGDSAPRSRPTFAAWSSVLMLAVLFVNVVAGAMLATVFDQAREKPYVFVVIGCALTFGWAPIAVATLLSPSFQPIRDLAEGTKRVGAGDYSQRLPVVQDDDLGALAASFNRMQAGLAERQRLQAAFGTYVDPILAARLLEQGDDVFTGEDREVTVMFVDVRDFTVRRGELRRGHRCSAQHPVRDRGACRRECRWARQQVSR